MPELPISGLTEDQLPVAALVVNQVMHPPSSPESLNRFLGALRLRSQMDGLSTAEQADAMTGGEKLYVRVMAAAERIDPSDCRQAVSRNAATGATRQTDPAQLMHWRGALLRL